MIETVRMAGFYARERVGMSMEEVPLLVVMGLLLAIIMISVFLLIGPGIIKSGMDAACRVAQAALGGFSEEAKEQIPMNCS